ncbi:hypothetical protein GCM10010532_016270 [Dactylosporangium siamense]|uniref:Uncharacterized protein n=1 Tax=Dactylosporangium siamense TaxID=685454 RepID=A0A919PEL4_9ACTN|nr:hypothetical protein Dsi01nite_000130 [Dactylosporangium siamense]
MKYYSNSRRCATRLHYPVPVGYDFAAEDAGTSYRLNDWQMGHVRLVMLEAGAVAGDGLARLFGNERFAPSADTVPVGHFSSNDGWQVTAAQCAFIAARLRAALDADLIGDMALFYYDQPTQLRDWVEEFAAFNEQATAQGGYRVS